MKYRILATALWAACPLFAEDDHREMEAHEHGVSVLQMAIEDTMIEMHLSSPGADIVGFEYVPESDADKEAVMMAKEHLENVGALFGFDSAAGCAATEVHVHYSGEEDQDEDHDAHEHDDAHDDHDHDEGRQHSEFVAEYELICEDISQLSTIEFPFFEIFPNAREIDVELVSEKGAIGFEVTKDEPVLEMKGHL